MRQISEDVSSHKISQNQKVENSHHDIIQETRKTIKDFTKQQRFQKAQRHLLDALDYKQARNDIDTNHNWLFQASYHIQTSKIWKAFLFAISFLYMYLIIGEPTNRLDITTLPSTHLIILQILCLSLFWLDILMEIKHKSSWKVTFSKKYPSRFWIKITMHVLFLIDVAVYYSHLQVFPLRLFRILRPFLPYLYDEFARNILKSLALAYKDIIAYFIFYAIAIFSFGAIGSIIIRLPQGTQYDPMQSDYSNFFQMSFLMYVVSSYDTYPDYQMVALNVSIYYYIFWITFIFMNALFFVNIPNTFIFMSFKKFRSKQILIDEIRQQTCLVLSFICLGEDHLSIPSDTFHQFMLYFYKNKLRLIDHIKELSFRLDQNNNQQIFISDFLKICKLIENDEYLQPPLFPDWQPYFTFRNFLVDNLKLKQVVNSYYYEIIVGLFVIGNFTLILYTFFHYVDPTTYTILEAVFVGIFIIDILMRILAGGIEEFFANYFNSADVIVVLVSLGLLCAKLNNSGMLKIIRLVRILRLFRIARLLAKYDTFRKGILQNTYGRKVKILFTQLYVAMMVGLRIFPVFCTIFYIFGIIGMQFLSFNQSGVTSEESPYSAYAAYSSFQNFIDSQLISIQILIESGWSYIVFDYAYRFNNRVGIFLFFIFQHAIIVQVISATMKGLVGDLYDSVYLKIRQIEDHQDEIIKEAKIEKKMKDQLFAIKNVLSWGLGLTEDTLKKKQIQQNISNKQLMSKLKKHYQNRYNEAELPKNIRKKSISSYALQSSLIDMKGNNKNAQKPSEEPIPEGDVSSAPLKHKNMGPVISPLKKLQPKSQDMDLQQIYESLLSLMNVNNQQSPCPQTPLYPKFLVQFLNRKFVIADQIIQKNKKFDMTKEAISTPESISFYINQLEGILNIKKPEDKMRKQIRQAILKLKTTSNQQLQRLLNKEYKGSKAMTISNILRNVFLMGVNKDLVQKFQIQYFSDIYGESFKQMNRVTMQPLLKHESLMIHTFSKLLKYPGIQTQNFFNMLATIEENISKTLVKKGSIFKFVFQVAELANNWFTIEVKKGRQLKVHFLKTGIWTYLKTFQIQKIYYAQDIFHFDSTKYTQFKSEGCQKTIRLLYNNFQSLGFSLLESHFFNSDPCENVYDVYNMTFDCNNNKHKRFNKLQPLKKQKQPIKISKIMLVILSKQCERAEKLSYKLSNLDDVIQQNKKQNVDLNFAFNEAQSSTFEKLQNMAAQDHEKISESQGLPFAFIVDMMKSVKDVMKLYKQTLISKVQEVLNKEFNKIEQKKEDDDLDNIFKADWFPFKFL